MINNLQKLYDRDFNLWIEKMSEAIKTKDIANMDWVNLLDEVETLGRNDKNELSTYTYQIIDHIFKLNYWESELKRCQGTWTSEIVTCRFQISLILEDSPSLKKYMEDKYLDWYADALKSYRQLNIFKIPDHEPVSLETLLSDEYFG